MGHGIGLIIIKMSNHCMKEFSYLELGLENVGNVDDKIIGNIVERINKIDMKFNYWLLQGKGIRNLKFDNENVFVKNKSLTFSSYSKKSILNHFKVTVEYVLLISFDNIGKVQVRLNDFNKFKSDLGESCLLFDSKFKYNVVGLKENEVKHLVEIKLLGMKKKCDDSFVVVGFVDSCMICVLKLEKIVMFDNKIKSFLNFSDNLDSKGILIFYNEDCVSFEDFKIIYEIFCGKKISLVNVYKYKNLIDYFGIDLKNVKIELNCKNFDLGMISMKGSSRLIVFESKIKYEEYLMYVKHCELTNMLPFVCVMSNDLKYDGNGKEKIKKKSYHRTFLSIGEYNNLVFTHNIKDKIDGSIVVRYGDWNDKYLNFGDKIVLGEEVDGINGINMYDGGSYCLNLKGLVSFDDSDFEKCVMNYMFECDKNVLKKNVFRYGNQFKNVVEDKFCCIDVNDKLTINYNNIDELVKYVISSFSMFKGRGGDNIVNNIDKFNDKILRKYVFENDDESLKEVEIESVFVYGFLDISYLLKKDNYVSDSD